METATRDSWRHVPLPASRTELPLTRTYSAEAFGRMQQGLVPEQMEDKWFIYCENEILHIHRSWSGHQMYQVEFLVGGNGEATINKCFVNRDPSQYQAVDDAYDAQLVCFLIDRLLLGKPMRFPTPGTVSPEERPLYVHRVIGFGRSNGE